MRKSSLGSFIEAFSGFPHSSVGKESACNAGDPGLIPGLVRSSGGGNGNPLQYSCLENPTDRGAWQATVHWVARVQHLASKQLTIESFSMGLTDANKSN